MPLHLGSLLGPGVPRHSRLAGGSLQTTALPASLISPRQSRAGSAGAMASPPCGPGCEDEGDLGVLRKDRPQGVSSLRLVLHITSATPQGGELPLRENLALVPVKVPVCSRDTHFRCGQAGHVLPPRASLRGLFPPMPVHQQVPVGFSPWMGHQALEMLRGGCQPLLSAGLNSPETHVSISLGLSGVRMAESPEEASGNKEGN